MEVEAIPEMQSCEICLSPFRDPVMLTMCGHTFCKECVNELPTPRSCPTCHAGPFDEADVCPNYAVSGMKDECNPKVSHHSNSMEVPGGITQSYKKFSLRRLKRTDEEQIESYVNAGVPWYLAENLTHEEADVGRRVFLLDNSGSTSCADGHVLLEKSSGDHYCVPATRWEEIRAMAIDHAKWHAAVGTPCDFLLLNSPRPGAPMQGRDYAVIDPDEGDIEGQMQVLLNLLDRNGPRGGTPLAQRLQALRARLMHNEEVMNGSRITLTIATDGLPTSVSPESTPEDQATFVEELRRFAQAFNAMVIIRLTTDDEEVVGFCNRLDAEVELPLDIIDDLHGEASELFLQGNGWLTYSPLLHRLREAGATNKLFDVLDERRLTIGEISELSQMLFRKRDEPPFPRHNAELLFEIIAKHVAVAAPVFDGRRSCMVPPVDLRMLRKALSLGQRCVSCSAM
eukprot:TRINITY_DN10292_c0_g1_i2.p1 TRINITY_DN10292_c0_g1~~TRINITY_DN10292_c0_g1_i2.p1  ORF type:complete len:455 (-),score=77.45 TRINITY_DN10292_c0_g1_i2:34-1398(-)